MSRVMKKLILTSIGTVALMSGIMAQDMVVVRGANSYRAGYSTLLKTLDSKLGLTLNAWLLTDVSDIKVSFSDFQENYAGFGVHYPVIKREQFTLGVAAGWSGSVKRITQRVGDGEWGLGLFLRYNW